MEVAFPRDPELRDELLGERDAFAELSRFRTAFYGSLTARADAFFELTDALLCADGPTRTPVELSLLAEHRRGYGSLYGALNHGRSKAAAQIIPGWPFSFVAALTPDRTSWTAVLDAVRLGPEDDAIAVTAHQLRQVVERLIRAGQWSDGDRDVLVVMDAGYDVTRLAWLLSDLPVELVGRLRSDRVLRLPKPPRVYDPKGGRPPEHGPEFRLAKPETWPEPAVVTMNDTPRYGKAEARAWDRVHPRLTHRSAWKKCSKPSARFLGWALRSVAIGASGGLHVPSRPAARPARAAR
ncbi:DDE superfamily endonuclease, partial [Streptomyces sp. MnatMP-M27]